MNVSPDRSITAVVFDIGGVLVDWNPRYLYRKLIPDPADMEWFLGTVCTPQWHDAHDRGADMRASCAALARQWPDYADLVMAWSGRSEEMIGGPIPGGVRLLRQLLDSGLDCYALTNMEAETYPGRRERFEFFGWFKGTVVSGFEGIAKPDQEIYERLLGRFGLDPATTLFTDDSPVNVAAAASTGMDAVLYTGPEAVLSRPGLAVR